jgi:peptidoglycan endopeptidase LytE
VRRLWSVFAATAATSLVLSVSPFVEAATYQVQPGNTLSGIAAQFHTSVQTLAAINHLANVNWIYVGQVLTVPSASSAAPATYAAPMLRPASGLQSYTVQPGQTLSQIAATFGTSWQQLAQINHLSNPNWLWVGEVLSVPATGGSSAAASHSSATYNSVSLPVAAAPQSLGQAIARTALQYLGVPYVWGGSNPSEGFDCSGLVQYVLAQNGIAIGRTTWAQWDAVTKIPESELQPGDLVFFSTYAPGASHVGIYIGAYPALGYQHAFVDAPAPGQTVMVQSLNNPYYVAHYYGAGVVNP